MRRALDGADAEHIPSDAFENFRLRAERIDWHLAAQYENAFFGSAQDLIKYAPVANEFKDLDTPVVSNSIRFRW